MFTVRSFASLALALSLAAGCYNAKPQAQERTNPHVHAAHSFNRHYGASRLSSWNVRASAAGPQCDVLLVEVDIVLEDAMVLAMHYGEGAYDIYDGGVKQFAGERDFRATAYVDQTGKRWKFGPVPAALARCAS